MEQNGNSDQGERKKIKLDHSLDKFQVINKKITNDEGRQYEMNHLDNGYIDEKSGVNL